MPIMNQTRESKSTDTLNQTLQTLIMTNNPNHGTQEPASASSTDQIDKSDLASSGIGSLAESDTEVESDIESVATVAKSVDGLADDSDENSTSSGSCNSNCSSSASSVTSLKVRHFSFGALTALQKANSGTKQKEETDPKKVRFADSLGLDLVQVQLFDRADDYKMAPMTLPGAMPSTLQLTNLIAKTIVPMFKQPGSFPNFLQLVRDNKVCLENAFLEQGNMSVKGIVRVLNMDYHKAVYIRWTVNEWRSMMDYKAAYLADAHDGFSDKFQFKIYAPLDVGQSLVFAVRYHCVGQQFWDNNNGHNFRFKCMLLSDIQKAGDQNESLP